MTQNLHLKLAMKAALTFMLLLATVAMLLIGCRSVRTHEKSTAFPLPPAPLSQFLKNPTEGTYSLPTPAHSGYGLDLKVLIVSGDSMRLSCCEDGTIGTNDWNYVEVKPALPPEEVFQEISAGATEEEVESRFGRPTWEQDRKATINWQKPPINTRVVHYEWCAITPSSEFLFLRLTATYEKKSGVWSVRDFRWVKWQDRRLSSDLRLGADSGWLVRFALGPSRPRAAQVERFWDT